MKHGRDSWPQYGTHIQSFREYFSPTSFGLNRYLGVIRKWAIGASDSKEQIIKRADKALYHAKEHGRNKCIKEDEIIV